MGRCILLWSFFPPRERASLSVCLAWLQTLLLNRWNKQSYIRNLITLGSSQSNILFQGYSAQFITTHTVTYTSLFKQSCHYYHSFKFCSKNSHWVVIYRSLFTTYADLYSLVLLRFPQAWRSIMVQFFRINGICICIYSTFFCHKFLETVPRHFTNNTYSTHFKNSLVSPFCIQNKWNRENTGKT